MTAISIKDLFAANIDGELKPRPARPGLPYPKANPHFRFKAEMLRKLLRFFSGASARNNLLLTGVPGVGKTAVLEQTAARLGWPVWSVSCSGRARPAHWLGTFGLRDGATVWQDGPLTMAIRHGGLFIADEITRMDAGEQMALVRVLDGGTLTLPETGESITPHPLFRFAATGNSAGFGDETGIYVGERVSSFAFVDRFMKLEVGYLDPSDEEALIVAAVPGLPTTIAKAIVGLASSIRGAFAGSSRGGGLRVGMSTRAALAVAHEAKAYAAMGIKEPLEEAVNDILLAGAPSEDAEAIKVLIRRFLSES